MVNICNAVEAKKIAKCDNKVTRGSGKIPPSPRRFIERKYDFHLDRKVGQKRFSLWVLERKNSTSGFHRGVAPSCLQRNGAVSSRVTLNGKKRANNS